MNKTVNRKEKVKLIQKKKENKIIKKEMLINKKKTDETVECR